MPERIDTYSRNGFVCPHCSHTYTEPEGLHYTDDRDPEENCDSCGKTFFVRTDIMVAWETFKTEDEL